MKAGVKPRNAEIECLKRITADIEHNRVPLPILPEIAIKVRDAVASPSVTHEKLARIINADASISARLLQVANSPLYRGQQPFRTVQTAITRLGIKLVRNLVSSLAMEQVYRPGSGNTVGRHLARLWSHNVTVAAISNVLARKFTRLSPDEAMLGGLLHDIGALPILVYTELFPELLNDDAALRHIISELHAQVGRVILESWRFSPELTACAAEHEKLDRNPSPAADYCDVVLIANLHSHIGTGHPLVKNDWSRIAAFGKLGLDPDQSMTIMAEARKEIAAIERMLKV